MRRDELRFGLALALALSCLAPEAANSSSVWSARGAGGDVGGRDADSYRGAEALLERAPYTPIEEVSDDGLSEPAERSERSEPATDEPTDDTETFDLPPFPDDDTFCTPATIDEVELAQRFPVVPVLGITPDRLRDTFVDRRSGGRRHNAIDILAPRRTPILALEDGRIVRMKSNRLGGLTLYHLDPSQKYTYYYAHLDSYAPGLREGDYVTQGQVIGYVGTTGNAPRSAPHLHFAIYRLEPERSGWLGTPINPYKIFHPGACSGTSRATAAQDTANSAR
jgi:peptidoglycan LD-endopeptidase LytH